MQPPVAGRADAVAGPQKIRLREHQRGREPAGNGMSPARRNSRRGFCFNNVGALDQPPPPACAIHSGAMMNGIGSSCHGRSMRAGRHRRCKRCPVRDEPFGRFRGGAAVPRAQLVEGLRQPRVMSGGTPSVRRNSSNGRRAPLDNSRPTGGARGCLIGVVTPARRGLRLGLEQGVWACCSIGCPRQTLRKSSVQGNSDSRRRGISFCPRVDVREETRERRLSAS